MIFVAARKVCFVWRQPKALSHRRRVALSDESSKSCFRIGSTKMNYFGSSRQAPSGTRSATMAFR